MNSIDQRFRHQNGPLYQRSRYIPFIQLPQSDILIYAHNCNIFLYSTKLNVLSIYRGHKSQVTAIAVHPQGYSVVSGDKQGNLKVWCPTHETLLTEYETTLTQQINVLQYAFDGSKVLIGLQQGKSVFQILDVKLKTFKSVNAEGDILCVCNTINRPFKYIGCNTEGFASVGNGFGDFEKSFKMLQNMRSVVCVYHTLDPKKFQLFICGNLSGNMAVVNLSDEKTLWSDHIHTKSILSLQYIQDLDIYISLSNDGTSKVHKVDIQKVNDNDVEIKITTKVNLPFDGLPISSIYINQQDQYIIYSNNGSKYVWSDFKQQLANCTSNDRITMIQHNEKNVFAYNQINFIHKCTNNDIISFTDEQIINYTSTISLLSEIKGNIKLIIEEDALLQIFTTVGYYKLTNICSSDQNKPEVTIDERCPYNNLRQVRSVSQMSSDVVAVCTNEKIYHFNFRTNQLQDMFNVQNNISEFLCMDHSGDYYVVAYKDKVSSQKNGIIILDNNFQQQGGVCKYFSNISTVKATNTGIIGAGTDGALIFALYTDFVQQDEVWPHVPSMDYSKSTVGQVQHITLYNENIAIISGHLGLIWWNFAESTETNKKWGKLHQGLDSKSAAILGDAILFGGIDGCIYESDEQIPK